MCATALINESLDWQKMGGLMPAVIQHATNGQVLMLGYMNEEALQQSLTLGKVCFYSRSKNRIWMKGETSGNHLFIRDIHKDCDNDALLVIAEPRGPTCHEGKNSCFDKQLYDFNVLSYIEAIINERRQNYQEESYISKLSARGLNRIAQKVGEEAVEVVIAALAEDDESFLNEMADLLFHMQLLLAAKGFGMQDVLAVMKARAKNA